jgi:hypothetical protein
MANDLDDLDGAEVGPQPAQGRELVIVDLRHATIMPPPWLTIGPLPWLVPSATASASERATTPGTVPIVPGS